MSAEPTPCLSIIIVSWNTRKLLQECLDSVFANPPQCSYDVWVIDNASSDGSPQMVKDCFPQVRLIENQHNPGFAGANNQGIRLSRGAHVLLLNPDTVVKPGAFETLMQFMDESPQTGAVGSRLLNADGSLQISCFPCPTIFREFWRLFHLDAVKPVAVYPQEKWSLDEPRIVDSLLGACLMLRRDALNQVGLLDEKYHMYSEETDLCYRVQKSGYQLYWVPQAEVIHYGGQSTKQIGEKMFYHLYLSKVQFFRKHHGPLAARLYKGVLFMATTGRLVVSPLVYLKSGDRRQRLVYLSRQYARLLASLLGM